jgi:hypothetical protein
MLAAGSFKSSKWGYDMYIPTGGQWYSNITTASSYTSVWSAPTLAPNGFIYMLPTTNTVNTGTTLDGVLVLNPGQTNRDAPSSNFVEANGSASKPNIPIDNFYTTPTTLKYSNRYLSKGILAPNGLIYFTPSNAQAFVVLDPSGGQNPTWTVAPFNTIGIASNAFFTGGVLGQDGCIYLIPQGTQTCRIKPKNTAVNPTSNDIYELGYWTGATNRNWAATDGGFVRPRDYNTGNQIATQADPVIPQATNKNLGLVRDAISHPNGNIYVFPYTAAAPTAQSRFVFIIRPAEWGTTKEITTTSTLGMDSVTGNLGSIGNVFLEKLKDGQDPDTLKMYGTYFISINGSANVAIPNNKSVVYDPTTNTWELVGSQDFSNQNPTTTRINAYPGIQLANGMLFSLTGNSNSTVYNPDIGQVIITGNDVDENVVCNMTDNIIINAQESLLMRNIYAPRIVAQLMYVYGGTSIPITGANKNGKTIFSGMGGGFITSVKGYHPGIKYFSYNPEDAAIYEIPSDLETLPTSLWNSYFNKPF